MSVFVLFGETFEVASHSSEVGSSASKATCWRIAESRACLPADDPVWTKTLGDDEADIRMSGFADGRIAIVYPGEASFLLDPASRVVQYDASVGVEQLEHLLLDHIAPYALASEGAIMLHAAALVVGGGAIAFAGVSGSGKSTLSAALASRAGFELMTDDVVRLDWAEGTLGVTAGRRTLRLWPDSYETLFRGEGGRADKAGKYELAGVSPSVVGSVPLRRIYLLRPDASEGSAAISACTPREAMLLLAESVFRANLQSRSLLSNEFRALETLARSGIVRRLTHRQRYDDLAGIAGLIEADLAQDR